MDNKIDILKKTLSEKKEEYLSYLMDLVAIDTMDLGHGIEGGREKAGQIYLEKLYKNMSVDKLVRDQLEENIIQKSISEHGEGNPGHDYHDRYNMYALFEGEDSERSIMFNSHIDTMPPGDVTLWKYPPHSPTPESGKLYGLGAADMKGGLMASVMAVKLLQDAGMSLPCNVKITTVCDEEGGGNGSIQAAMRGENADAVIVCEPTGNALIRAHMGFVFFKVEITGKANHSGEKHLGVSAIEKAIKLIKELEELEKQWVSLYKHELLPPPNLNIGTIHGGSAGSTVAGYCYFETCIHYIPDVMSFEQVSEEFREKIRVFAESDEWLKNHMPVLTLYQSGGGFEQNAEARIAKVFQDTYRECFDEDVRLAGSPAGCDSRIWKNIAGSQVLQYGPGNLEQCHAVNEYIEIEEYYKAILLYANLILNWGKDEKKKDEK